MTNKTRILRVTNAQVIEALRATGGFISLTAQRCGCSPRTIHRRINASAKIQEELHHIRDKKLDLAEVKLIEALNNGAPWAICFYLKCQGKQRGYVERQEITGRDGGALKLAPDDITDEELEIGRASCRERV